jgi:hypothetical protein
MVVRESTFTRQLLCLSVLVGMAQHSMAQGVVEVCVAYQPAAPPAHSEYQLWQSGKLKITTNLPGRDTCLSLTVLPGTFYSVVVQTPGYPNATVSFRSDTLKNEQRIQLFVRQKTIQLAEVIVRPESRLSYRGDTLVIATDGIETLPYAEATDLLGQLPGVSISPDGTVSVMGRQVGQMTVDGNSLFGGNAKAILNVIRADMIQQVEVIQRVLPNGRRTTAVNLKLKADRTHGTYGNVGVGYGSYGRYKTTGQFTRLKPKKLLSIFASWNNTNDNLLSPSEKEKLIAPSLLNTLTGAASVVETGETRTITRTNQRTQHDEPTDIGRTLPGQNELTGVGLSFSNNSGKVAWSGFMLADGLTGTVFKTNTLTRFLSPLIQQTRSTATHADRKFTGRASLSGTYPITTKQRLSFAGYVVSDQNEGSNQGRQAVSLVGGNTANTTVLGTHFLNETSSRQAYQVQVLWVKQHGRQGQTTSAYASLNQSGRVGGQVYQNTFSSQNSLPGLANFHRLDQRFTEQILTGQLVHSLPLSKKWLLEGKLTLTHEAYTTQQTANQTDSSETELAPIPGLTLARFRCADTQVQGQLTLLYQTRKLTANAGLSVWDWRGERHNEGAFLYRQQRLLFLPRLYTEYRFSNRLKVGLRVGVAPTLAEVDQLRPVPDSTVVQQLTIGNPALTYQLQQQQELVVAGVLPGGVNVQGTFQFQQQVSPIITTISGLNTAFPTQSFAQVTAIQRGWQVNFIAISVLRNKAFGWYVFGAASQQDLLMQFESTTFVQQRFFFFAGEQLNYTSAKGIRISVAGRTVVGSNRQQKSPGQSNWQQELNATIEKNWLNRWHGIVQTTYAIAGGGGQTNKANNLITDVGLTHYLTPRQRLKVSLWMMNVADQQTQVSVSPGINSQAVTNLSRLPRYVQLSATAYLDKWQK